MSRSGKNSKKSGKSRKSLIIFLAEILVLMILVCGIFVFAKINAGLRSIGSRAGAHAGVNTSAGTVTAGKDVPKGSSSAGAKSDPAEGGQVKVPAAVTPDPNADADAAEENTEVTSNRRMKGYTNIALVGIDTRDTDQIDYANSDTMIIASINNETGKVRLISLYRDTLLNIGTKSDAEVPQGDDDGAEWAADFEEDVATYEEDMEYYDYDTGEADTGGDAGDAGEGEPAGEGGDDGAGDAGEGAGETGEGGAGEDTGDAGEGGAGEGAEDAGEGGAGEGTEDAGEAAPGEGSPDDAGAGETGDGGGEQPAGEGGGEEPAGEGNPPDGGTLVPATDGEDPGSGSGNSGSGSQDTGNRESGSQGAGAGTGEGAEAGETTEETPEVTYANNTDYDTATISEESNGFTGVTTAAGKYDKANAAYANGSARQLLTMLNRNFDLNIHDYVVVDFNAVAKLVDDIDGIDVWMTEQEVVHMNNYCIETSSVTGLEYVPIEPETMPRDYHLNGVQAVAYARIRYTTGNDMKRTQRQRVVIHKIVNKAKKRGIQTVQGMIRDVFPLCKTSFSASEIIRLASQMFTFEIEKTSGFPFEHLEKNVYAGSKKLDAVVPVTLADNVAELHEFLFDDTDYQVSSTVAEFSADIESLSNLTAKSREAAIQNSVIGLSGGEADVVI